MPTEIRIGSHLRRDAPECFVTAEVGQNHGGDVEVCKRIFQAAKYAGGDRHHAVHDREPRGIRHQRSG